MQARNVALFAVLTVLIGCKSPAQQPPDPAPETAKVEAKPVAVESPKRIIMFIGDGMGVGAVTAAAYAKGEPLQMMTMPTVSWLRNHEHEFVATDSAASATAFATGNKTHFQGVSVKPGTTVENEEDPANHFASVIRFAEAKGMKTGLVATSRINHATPGAFASNRYYRKQYDEIALDMSRSGVDVLLGAGTDFFEKRKDGQDLMKGFADRGYAVARTADEVREASGSASKLVGLLHERDMPMIVDGGRAMTLPEMTKEAIEVLDRDAENGWFLMVEGSFIDWCEHDLASACTIAETLDFDGAVGVGLEYARGRDDTLIVATADHETGGVSVLDPRYVGRFADALGGEAEAVKAGAPPADLDPPMEVERLPAFFAIGSGTWDMALEPIDTPKAPVYGFTDLADWRYALSFGHLSVQSRAMLQQGEQRDFYGAHTVTHVPMFAEGPGAKYMAEARDNAAFGQRLIELVEESSVQAAPRQPTTTPKNVIVMIGDGMGINPLSAAYYANGGLFMLDAPVTGIASTHAADRLVNDSAASATAIAIGERSFGGAVGMAARGGKLESAETLLETAERRGMKTGLVTTTQLTHATPAAFYAHVPSRSDNAEIADQFINMPERIAGSDGVDVAIAGGLDHFDEARRARLSELGYSVQTSWSGELPAGRSVSLLAPQGVPNARIRHRDGNPATPTLAEMTRAAMDQLAAQSGEEGFFLMVEGGQIDWLMHSMVDDATLVDEIVDFDQAVEAVVKWAQERGDTLVLVTADHDHTLSVIDNHYSFREEVNCRAAKACGGTHEYPAIDIRPDGVEYGAGLTDRELQGEYKPALHLQYGWIITEASKRKKLSGPHSANFVPVFAWGPGAAAFGGYLDQPTLGQRLRKSGAFGSAPTTSE